MTAKKKPSRISDAAKSGERKNDGRSSLDRLADLTRKVLRVPKGDLSSDAPPNKPLSG